MPVKPDPGSPAAAATLVLVRDWAGGGSEILLMQRHRASRFAGGDFVFPGGKVEVDDAPANAADRCAGLTGDEAARVLAFDGEPRTALGFWIAAIRETFEEVGVLLAYGPDGRLARLEAGRARAYRRACQADHRAFWAMLEAERLVLATDRLTYFAHWVTPEGQPLRFDTRFFATVVPPGLEATLDEREAIAVRWLTPRQALDAHGRGEISLRVVTAKNLELFDGAPSADAAVRRLAGRVVETIRPRVVVEGGRRRILLPGDPGYAR